MSTGLTEILNRVASEYADKIAIYDNGISTTYRDLEDQVLRTAQYFTERGIRKNDKVLVLVPVSTSLYRVTLALNAIGAAAIFIEGWIDRAQIERTALTTKPDAVIANWPGLILSKTNKALRSIPVKLLASGYKKYSRAQIKNVSDENDIALISFTSGSDGNPKMIRRSFKFLTHQYNVLQELKRCESADVELVFLPAFLFLNLLTGSTSVLMTPSKNIHKASKQISKLVKKLEINAICASPANIMNLTELRTIRKVLTGGAPIFPVQAERMLKIFPEADIKLVYGSSEAEPISMITATELINSSGDLQLGLSVGKIHELTSLQIIPIEGLPFNEQNSPIGEIVVKGPNVLLDPQSPGILQIDGEQWHRTGDSGRLFENHTLALTGRCESLVYVDGRIFSALVFEGYCKNIQGIERATIVENNNRLVAVVQTNSKEKDRIMEEIHKLPFPVARTVFLDKIPLDPRHRDKIRYGALKEMLKNYSDKNQI